MATALKAKSRPLNAKQLEAARKLFGIRDKTASPTTNEKGDVLADPDLRDAEYIPFSVIGHDVVVGIEAYFNAEVKPHWSDAWINTDVKDARDGQAGIVGCEINFNREFYVYQAPRRRDEIRRDIDAMEKQFPFREMLKRVVG